MTNYRSSLIPVRRSGACLIRLTGRDAAGLCLVAEQYTVPHDHLGTALEAQPPRLRQAQWASERDLRADTSGTAPGHVPYAEAIWPSMEGSPHAGQTWAIECELTPKTTARMAADVLHRLDAGWLEDTYAAKKIFRC